MLRIDKEITLFFFIIKKKWNIHTCLLFYLSSSKIILTDPVDLMTAIFN